RLRLVHGRKTARIFITICGPQAHPDSGGPAEGNRIFFSRPRRGKVQTVKSGNPGAVHNWPTRWYCLDPGIRWRVVGNATTAIDSFRGTGTWTFAWKQLRTQSNPAS